MSTCVQSRYPYEPSETKSLFFSKTTKVSWLFDELSDNNASYDGLSLSTSVAVNKQILKVSLMIGKEPIRMACQINTRYNTYPRDSVFCHYDINEDLHFVKSTPINDSLKEVFNLITLLYLTGSFLIGCMEVRYTLLYYQEFHNKRRKKEYPTLMIFGKCTA